MPTERRNTRSSKSDDKPPADTGKSRSNSGSTNKKPAPTRSTSSRSKATNKPESASQGKKMSGDKQRANGSDPKKDEVNGTEDVEMTEEGSKQKKNVTGGKGKEGEDEMTVVVPPSRSSKTPPKDSQMDSVANGTVEEATESKAAEVDPKEKAINGTDFPA